MARFTDPIKSIKPPATSALDMPPNIGILGAGFDLNLLGEELVNKSRRLAAVARVGLRYIRSTFSPFL